MLNREMTYKTFKRKYRLSFEDRRKLKQLRIIEIFQGGYRGHSTMHHKKIRIRNFTRLRAYIEHLKEPDGHEFEYPYTALPAVGSNLFQITKSIQTANYPKRYGGKGRLKDDGLPFTNMWIINEYINEIKQRQRAE